MRSLRKEKEVCVRVLGTYTCQSQRMDFLDTYLSAVEPERNQRPSISNEDLLRFPIHLHFRHTLPLLPKWLRRLTGRRNTHSPKFTSTKYDRYGGFSFAFLKDPIPFRSGPRCPHATANIVCISVLSRVEAESIQRRRAKTMWENMLEPPTILLGLDIEARSEPEVVHKLFLEPSLSTGKVGPVIPEEGERLAQEIGAVKYMECSVNDTAQVEALFQDALRIATRSPWNNLAEWVVAFQNSY